MSREFYERAPEFVAKELLGKRLIRKLGKNLLEGIIVETEAYYGLQDPASRAYHGIKNYNKPMWNEPGRAFIYNVHKYWMLNIVAHKPNQIGAVLIRAMEPTKGMEVMEKNKPVMKLFDLTNGPGKLTIALKINKGLNGVPVTSCESEIIIANNRMEFEIGSSHRIGVRKDLKRKLRFFIKGNKFVSR
ncbi:MAG: DNA-3-methyladenine glycosylase [Candidatus Bathyarchaeota archaeon]|nr:DNA-3-methyladenine glycosylase [Candidatus Bathyarchaeota archaeon]